MAFSLSGKGGGVSKRGGKPPLSFFIRGRKGKGGFLRDFKTER